MGNFQQRIADNVPFPCDVNGYRSKTIPNSVHQLRPGKQIEKKVSLEK